MRAIAFLFVLHLPYLVNCQNIVQLVVQTNAVVGGAACNCPIGISITNTDLLACDIEVLTSGGTWDFQPNLAIGYEVYWFTFYSLCFILVYVSSD